MVPQLRITLTPLFFSLKPMSVLYFHQNKICTAQEVYLSTVKPIKIPIKPVFLIFCFSRQV